jgi:hypothetical protein
MSPFLALQECSSSRRCPVYVFAIDGGHALNPAAPSRNRMQFVEDKPDRAVRNLDTPCIMSLIVRPNGRRAGSPIPIRPSNWARQVGAPCRAVRVDDGVPERLPDRNQGTGSTPCRTLP